MPFRIEAEPRLGPNLRTTESGNRYILSFRQTRGSFSEPTAKNTSFAITSSSTPVTAAATDKIMVIGGNQYSLKQVVKGTKGFSPKNQISVGRFGTVYKCELPNGGPVVAVRRLSSQSHRRKEQIKRGVYLNQVIKHDNIVQFLGYFRDLHLLVYEYMEYKSIADVLFDPNSEIQLNWATRYNICIGAAKGLEFLHNSTPQIVHRNIKPSNVLLDENMKAKISDLGLATPFEEDMYPYGLLCPTSQMYMAPEYAIRKAITDKADVYSFGIVLLELVSGKRTVEYKDGQEAIFLLDKAFVLQSKGKLWDLVDGKLFGDQTYNIKQAIKVLELAMMCLVLSHELRPCMSQVVDLLEERITIKHLSELINASASSTHHEYY